MKERREESKMPKKRKIKRRKRSKTTLQNTALKMTRDVATTAIQVSALSFTMAKTTDLLKP